MGIGGVGGRGAMANVSRTLFPFIFTPLLSVGSAGSKGGQLLDSLDDHNGRRAFESLCPLKRRLLARHAPHLGSAS